MNSAAPALEFAQVVKDYVTNWRGQRWRALAEVSFLVSPGSICALVGANGAGKTTVLKIAAGVTWPTHGRCTVMGCAPSEAAAAGRVGYLPEHLGFPTHLTVRDVLAESASFLAGEVDPAAAVREALEEVALIEIERQFVATLSRGQRQRLGLAQAMCGSPRLLLLDEPASALDPRGVIELGRWLEARRRSGATIVLSSHFLPQLEELCDQFVLLDRGRVALAASRDEVLAAGGLTKAFLECAAR